MMLPTPLCVFDEDSILAHLYAYFDESGKQEDHPVVVFSGFVDGFEAWRTFGNEWLRLLRHYRLTEFHAAKALRHSQPYGAMKRGEPEDRAKDVLPFIRAITKHLGFGVVKALDVDAYKNADSLIHQTYGSDPHYYAFYMAIVEILRHFEIPREYIVGLILDDDEKKAIECYRLLKKLKTCISRD
jgi:hypothetical protein